MTGEAHSRIELYPHSKEDLLSQLRIICTYFDRSGDIWFDFSEVNQESVWEDEFVDKCLELYESSEKIEICGDGPYGQNGVELYDIGLSKELAEAALQSRFHLYMNVDWYGTYSYRGMECELKDKILQYTVEKAKNLVESDKTIAYEDALKRFFGRFILSFSENEKPVTVHTDLDVNALLYSIMLRL